MNVTDSPAAVRLRAAANTPTGWIVESGVRQFKTAVSGHENANAFNQWRASRFTQLLFLALQDLVFHPGLIVRTDDVQVQYGVTQGLALAAQLVSDPSVLWPNVFGPGMENAKTSQKAPNTSFTAPPDSGGQQTHQ